MGAHLAIAGLLLLEGRLVLLILAGELRHIREQLHRYHSKTPVNE